ncbi:DUF7844 domain-containing protein [Pseudomonas matsuisoli]|uniref:DUF4105 domain-containing protein n=1 Tax=Pseudomonas matsuisoli TaxID=1515666 RepID=A0A917PTH8_9PSED|nr:DUF4105 domain-containing protein [Pseudomonas matsuisoli]GGJ90889.1 hypothetical protein GCM10009304_15710 [Pseudomonas matsuisoli]
MQRLFLWLAAALFCSQSLAGLRLELSTDGLTSAQRAASQALLDEAAAALPPAFIERLDRAVTIEWTANLPEDAYGQITRLDALALNARLLPSLADGGAATTATDRPHGTVRQELLATVLHELTHLYDRSRLWTPDERRREQQCRRQQSTSGPIGLPEACRGQTSRRFTLSDDPRFLDLAGWQQQVGTRGEREHRNGQDVRSPDVYELANPREYLAVNMEYFLLDPSYACRRPSLHRFLANHFGWQPTKRDTCPSGYAFLNAGRDFGKAPLGRIDPERVYEIDYLFAESNTAWASRWGHSMLRLVICAPDRPRGPDCRLDLDQHLVLSYRAFVNDVQISSWDGLTGNYPSRLFFLPLAQVIDEYTKVEMRSLASVPLRLDRQEIAALVERSAEIHWGYDGDYYFLSNNCAVETLKLLRGGLARDDLGALDSIMPNGLLELLIARGIADDGPLKNTKEALRLGYRFDSYRDRYQSMFEVLKERLPVPQKTVEEWLGQTAESRAPWIEKSDLRASAAMLLLEQASMRRQLLLAQDELKQRYLSKAQNDELAKAGKVLEGILANSGFLSRPAELLDEGYGLPQAREWQRLESITGERQQQLVRLNTELDGELRRLLLPERRAELDAAQANVEHIGNHLRALHKANGGLSLP